MLCFSTYDLFPRERKKQQLSFTILTVTVPSEIKTPFMLSQGSGPLLKRSKLERPKFVHTAVFMPFSTTQGVCKAGTVAKVTYCPTSYKYCVWF